MLLYIRTHPGPAGSLDVLPCLGDGDISTLRVQDRLTRLLDLSLVSQILTLVLLSSLPSLPLLLLTLLLLGTSLSLPPPPGSPYAAPLLLLLLLLPLTFPDEGLDDSPYLGAIFKILFMLIIKF